MPKFDEKNAEVWVFTHKEGLAARLAHDLKIAARKFEFEIDEAWSSVRAEVDARSLEVVCARANGKDDLRTLSDSDKQKINGHMRDDVLSIARFPKIIFQSNAVNRKDKRAEIAGVLTLHGQSKPIRGVAVLENNRWTATFVVHQPDFGIKPFTAAFGALRVAGDVEIEVTLPAQ